MRKIESYVCKEFLYSFEKEFIKLRLDFGSDASHLQKYESVRNTLITSFVNLAISKTEIETIIRGTNNPFLKQILKSASFQIIDESIVNQLNEENFEDKYVKKLDNYPFKIFLVNDGFSKKRLTSLMNYHGNLFLSPRSISDITLREEYQVGFGKLDLDKIYKGFKPFNSMIIIDPYIFSTIENVKLLTELFRNIVSSNNNKSIYIDVITRGLDKIKGVDNSKYKNDMKKNIELINNDFGIHIVLSVHEVEQKHLHDRHFITNNSIINFGHGIPALKDRVESDIRIEGICSYSDNTFFLKKVYDKLSLFKRVISSSQLKNPIWQVLN